MGIPIHGKLGDPAASTPINLLGHQASTFPCVKYLDVAMRQQLKDIIMRIAPRLFRKVQQNNGRPITQVVPDAMIIREILLHIDWLLVGSGISPRIPDQDTLIELTASSDNFGDILKVKVKISDHVVGQEAAFEANRLPEVYEFDARPLRDNIEANRYSQPMRQIPVQPEESDDTQSAARRAQYTTQLRNLQALLVWRHQPHLEADANSQPNQQFAVEQQGIGLARPQRSRSTELFLRQMESDTNQAHQHLIRVIRQEIEAQTQPQLYEHRIIANLMIMRGFLAEETSESSMEPNRIEALNQQRYILYIELADNLGQEEFVLLHRIIEQIHGVRSLLQAREADSPRMVLGESLTKQIEQIIQEVEAMVFAQLTVSQSQDSRAADEQEASELRETNTILHTRQQERRDVSITLTIAEQGSSPPAQQEQMNDNSQPIRGQPQDLQNTTRSTIGRFRERSLSSYYPTNLDEISSYADPEYVSTRSRASASYYYLRQGHEMERSEPNYPALSGVARMRRVREQRNRERLRRQQELLNNLQNLVNDDAALKVDSSNDDSDATIEDPVVASVPRQPITCYGYVPPIHELSRFFKKDSILPNSSADDIAAEYDSNHNSDTRARRNQQKISGLDSWKYVLDVLSMNSWLSGFLFSFLMAGIDAMIWVYFGRAEVQIRLKYWLWRTGRIVVERLMEPHQRWGIGGCIVCMVLTNQRYRNHFY